MKYFKILNEIKIWIELIFCAESGEFKSTYLFILLDNRLIILIILDPYTNICLAYEHQSIWMQIL